MTITMEPSDTLNSLPKEVFWQPICISAPCLSKGTPNKARTLCSGSSIDIAETTISDYLSNQPSIFATII